MILTIFINEITATLSQSKYKQHVNHELSKLSLGYILFKVLRCKVFRRLIFHILFQYNIPIEQVAIIDRQKFYIIKQC